MPSPRLAIAVGLFLIAAGPAHADLLINGSFEAVDAGASPYYIRSLASTPGWTQIGDGVDLIHNNYTQIPGFEVLVDAADGVQFLDMNQLGTLGGIEQVVGVTTGTRYHLDLSTTAWARNAIGGTIGYELYDANTNTVLASGSYTDAVGGTWITRSLEATATSNRLGVRIQGLFATQAGMGLDNVRLFAAVPEPAAVVSLGLGLAAVAGVALRRRRDARTA